VVVSELLLTQLTESDVAPAAGVMARAFRDDPFHVYFLPDAGARAARLPVIY
jgi:hypothetical protein